MFSIIVSEKGGAERRETFDKNEINVGRVQGNDLMLPKGNVSKHHARLLFRDGRFIVTDLKSTNGTYVNGRKIAQATIVHDGDKIYIGDFVLRLEPAVVGVLPDALPQQPLPAPALPQPDIRPAPQPAPVAVTLKAPTHPPGLVIPKAAPVLDNGGALQSMETLQPGHGGNNGPPPAASPAPAPVMSPAPPGADARAVRPGSALPPRMMTAASPAAAPKAPSVAPPAPVQTLGPPPQARPAELNNRPKTAVPRASSREQAGRRLALQMLVGRVEDAIGTSLYARVVLGPDVIANVERALSEAAESMRANGEAPEGLDMTELERDARAEIVGIGPLDKLIDDSRVSEVSCSRYDQVVVVTDAPVDSADGSFSSERSLRRAMTRLLAAADPASADAPEAPIMQRRHPQGLLVCAYPPAAASPTFVLRKRRRIDATLEDLARQNALSRPMAAFLESCIVGHANVLVAGDAAPMVVAALMSASLPGERVCVVCDVDEIATAHAHVATLYFGDDRTRSDDVVRAVRALNVARTVVMNPPSRAVSALLEHIADGAHGVIVSSPAFSVKEALSHFVTSAGMAAPVDVVRDAVAGAFDILLEVAQTDRGARITRLSEITAMDAKTVTIKDLFTYNAEGEGSFLPSGATPRIVGDLAARGLKVDPGLFKRR